MLLLPKKIKRLWWKRWVVLAALFVTVSFLKWPLGVTEINIFHILHSGLTKTSQKHGFKMKLFSIFKYKLLSRWSPFAITFLQIRHNILNIVSSQSNKECFVWLNVLDRLFLTFELSEKRYVLLFFLNTGAWYPWILVTPTTWNQWAMWILITIHCWGLRNCQSRVETVATAITLHSPTTSLTCSDRFTRGWVPQTQIVLKIREDYIRLLSWFKLKHWQY